MNDDSTARITALSPAQAARILAAAGQEHFQHAFRVLPQAGIDGMKTVNEFLVAHEASPNR